MAGIVSGFDIDDSEFLATFDREWREFGFDVANKVGKQNKEIFEEWMQSWDRKYKIILDFTGSSSLNWIVDTSISNQGALATGHSNYDDRPPRDGVPGYLDAGTRRRFAVMTRVFKSKTAPGIIGSGAGIGGLSFVTAKTADPQPGIVPRDIEATAAKQMEEFVVDLVDDAIGDVFG